MNLLENGLGPNFYVGAWFKVFDMRQYGCGLEREPSLPLNQIPIIGTACRNCPLDKPIKTLKLH